MRSFCLIAAFMSLTTLIYAAEGKSVPCPKEAAKGFVSLFDGKSFEGWQKGIGGYQIEDGKLVSKKGGGGTILTRRQYADFILRFEYKLEPGGNNGVAIRSPLKRTPPADGMEIQILDDTSPKYKNLKDYQFNGSLYRRIPAKRGHAKPVGQWNSEEIMCKGSRLKITLNGTVILDADLEPYGTKAVDGSPHPGLQRKKGYLGFMGHHDRVEFRNIRIKEL
ncbi:MAG: DUF1080 domain-containing protein [Planctomycetota bacterium]|nr:DUF1080 domain-containing protein [Planctomycetota bacterium]